MSLSAFIVVFEFLLGIRGGAKVRVVGLMYGLSYVHAHMHRWVHNSMSRSVSGNWPVSVSRVPWVLLLCLGIHISMEAILACHPARSTEWLDCHPKSCELWRIRTGPIADLLDELVISSCCTKVSTFCMGGKHFLLQAVLIFGTPDSRI